MTPKTVWFLIFVTSFIIFIPIIAIGDQGVADLPPGQSLLLNQSGHFNIIGEADLTGMRYEVSCKGKPATGYSVVAKSSRQGVIFLVRKASGVPRLDELSITLWVDPDRDIKFANPKGSYLVKGMSGNVSGHFKKGQLVLEKCTGMVSLKMDDGQFKTVNHLSSKPFNLELENGNAVIEIGGKKPGPGMLKMEAGRVKWILKDRVPIRFLGEVEKGMIVFNLPINHKNPHALTFSSMNGQNLWSVNIENGMLDVVAPEPKPMPRRIYYK